MKAVDKASQQIHDFMDYLQVEKNASLHTVNSYRADMECFIAFARLQGAVGEVLFSTADTMLIRAYIAHLTSVGYSPGTISRRISSLKAFFRFLMKAYGVDNYPFSGIHIGTPSKAVPDVLTAFEMTKLLNMPGNDRLGIRDRAILELLYAAGLKAGELVRLKVNDVDFDNNYVLVYGQSKARIVPIGSFAVKALQDYLALSRPELCKTSLPSLFINAKGGALSDRSVRRIVNKYAENLGLKICPQTLRCAAAAHLLEGGADFESVQSVLGQGIKAAAFNKSVSRERLKSVYSGAHPRA